jgi:putative ABC transport system permease protein
MSDLRFALRQLLKNPGFTIVAVLTLALGIGANTAIFTVINTVLLRSLPVTNPHELVQVAVGVGSGQPNYTFSHPSYERLRDNGKSLSGLFAAGGVGLKDRLIVPTGGAAETEFVRAQAVSGNFFSVLGTPALLGRTITAEDNRTGDPQAVAVISHHFWQRRFAGDPSVVGRAVTFNDMPFIIVGVMPPQFFGFQPGENPELWWPLQVVPQVDRNSRLERLNSEGQRWLRLMGRLPPGVGRQQAEAELAAVYQRYRDEYLATREVNWPTAERERFLAQKLELLPGHAGWTGLRGQFRGPLLILMGVVAVVLLIACANVASLLLARAAARQREFSIRNSLGAGRLRLMRQLLTESLLLAALGGLLGILCAQGGTRLLQVVMELQSDPVSLSIAPDIRVLLFTTAVALGTGLLFGLAPAWHGSRPDLAGALKGSTGGVMGGAGRQRLLQGLVVGQVALSLALLVGAGLFVRTLQQLKGLDAGFNRGNVVLFNLDFAERPEPARWTAFYQDLLKRLEALPGVRSASLFTQGYLSDNSWTDRVSADGYVAAPGENLDCVGTRVGPEFFATMGTLLLSGREFGPQDERPLDSVNPGSRGTAVISQALARRYFGHANPLGRHIFIEHRPEQKFEIVGLVPDAKYLSLREEPLPAFYLPFFQEPRGPFANFALRTRGDPRATMAGLAGVVREVDHTVRVRDVRTMDDMVNRAVRQERLLAQLGGFFSVFALALACLGLYGVLSFAVVQRTREIGLRVALGAQKSDVLSLVIGKGLRLALAGAAIGLVGGLTLTRLVSSLLFGVTATDPATFVAVSILLVIVAFLASYIPARRATKVDPMVALRYE